MISYLSDSVFYQSARIYEQDEDFQRSRSLVRYCGVFPFWGSGEYRECSNGSL